MKIVPMLFSALTLTLHGAAVVAAPPAPAAPVAPAAASVVRMPYFQGDELVAADGSALPARLGGPPEVVDGEVVVAPPWPNLVDPARYAHAGHASVFHFETGAAGRRVVRIDVDADTGQVIRLRYDGAGNLVELATMTPDGQGGASVALTCYVYNERKQLTHYAAHVAGAADCRGLEAAQFSRSFAYDADGTLRRAIGRYVGQASDLHPAPALRVSVYDGAGAVLARLEGEEDLGVRLPPRRAGDGFESSYGAVSEQGEVAWRGPLPQSHRDWQIVRADGSDGAGKDWGDLVDLPRTVLAGGTGAVLLSAPQRAALAREVRAHPGRVWLTWGVDATELYPALAPAQWAACIDARRRDGPPCGVAPLADAAAAAAARARRAATRAAAAGWSVQAGFAGTAYGAEFAVWQDAFTADLNRLAAALRGEGGPGDAVLAYAGVDPGAAVDDADADAALLAPLFAKSIADTPKGRSLKRFLIRGWAQAQRQRSATLASVFIRQALGNPYLDAGGSTTRAVGYGGRAADGAFSNEVLYILPNGLNTLRPGAPAPDAAARHAVGAWASLALPPLGAFERDVWPLLLFARAPDGRLLMYGMAREMHTYCQRLHERIGMQ